MADRPGAAVDRRVKRAARKRHKRVSSKRGVLSVKKVAVVGAKRGTPLSTIEGIDTSLLDLLRSSYGITTLEEFVEAVSFSPELEREAARRTKSHEDFKYAYDHAREILGPDVVFKLQSVRQKYPTGALKPPKS